MSDLLLFVNKCAKRRLLTVLPSPIEMLALISLILVRMIQSLESGVRVLACLYASFPSLWIVGLALLWDIVKLIRLTPVIKRLVSIYTVIPVMILRLVCAKLGLVPIDVEYDRIYRLQVKFESSLKIFSCTLDTDVI